MLLKKFNTAVFLFSSPPDPELFFKSFSLAVLAAVTAYLLAGTNVCVLKKEWESWSSFVNNIIAVSVPGILSIYAAAPKEVSVVTQLHILCYI